MAVKIYKLSGGLSEVSSDLSFDNPILWEVSQKGGTLENRFFLRNDEGNTVATNVAITAIDSHGADESDWYSFALFSFAPDNGGSPGEYVETLDGLTIPENGEIPFWMKIDIPEAIEIGPKTDIRVKVSGIIVDA